MIPPDLDLSVLPRVLAGALAGIPLGILALTFASLALLRIVVGALPIFYKQ